MFRNRATQKELLDSDNLPEADLVRNLQELGTINKLLGGHAVTISALNKIFTKELLETNPKRIWRIADVGSGGGDTLRAISAWASRRRIAVHLIGIDQNPVMINYAKGKSERYIDISFRQADVFSDEFTRHSYDVITCNLFCHHFTNTQLTKLLPLLLRQSSQAVILNDIDRHPLAYYSIKALTALFSRSYLVKHDAPLSVLRAFKKTELQQLFQQAGIRKYQLHWKWAFRWQAIIRP